MPYTQSTADSISRVLIDKNVVFTEKKMFSGVCYFVDDKMLCGTHIDKGSGEDFLLCRIGPEASALALERPFCIPMEFTGRAMKGYVFVTEDGHKSYKDLAYWLDLCLAFNPKAEKSKKK